MDRKDGAVTLGHKHNKKIFDGSQQPTAFRLMVTNGEYTKITPPGIKDLL
jgi:hypothetical protein